MFGFYHFYWYDTCLMPPLRVDIIRILEDNSINYNKKMDKVINWFISQLQNLPSDNNP